ncbi:MAG TPA: hypothetical protein VMW52_02415, partial [Phycisphaerae bacterium]|nr:hypothetical protein [Phycisphaerae bacterium]
MASIAQRAQFSSPHGWPESPGLRTRNGKRWVNPADARQVDLCCSVSPVHYRLDPFSEDALQEIDLDVLPTPGEPWDAACETNGYQARFWQSLDQGGRTFRYVAQFRRAGKWLAMAPAVLIYTNGAGSRQVIATPTPGINAVIDNEANTVTIPDCFG